MEPVSPPPRWLLRLDEFDRMLDLFARTDATRRERPLNEAEEAGLVQFFELCVELGWKTIGARLLHEGVSLRERSPVAIVREAARAGWIADPDIWVAAIERRNMMSHAYDPDAFRALVADAGDAFLPSMRTLRDGFLEARDR